MLKIGLDIHGVIDTKPKLYATMTKRLISLGHEVHVITGAHKTDKLLDELKSYGIEWTHFFSIADYHKELGTDMTYTDPENPWMEDEVWDKTKALYCEKEGIDLHIDDSNVYGKYFLNTTYVQIKLDK